MEAAGHVATWVMCIVGALTLGLGITTLSRRTVALPWQRRGTSWKRWGRGQTLLGAGFIALSLPRLASLPLGIVAVLLVFGLAAMIAGAVQSMTSGQQAYMDTIEDQCGR